MKLISNLFPLIRLTSTRLPSNLLKPITLSRCLSMSPKLQTYQHNSEQFKPYPEPKRWPQNNLVVHLPQDNNEKPVTRIRGMSIDEAIKQLSFVPKKGAQIIKEVLIEAQEIAVREQNFEYKSNMWIGESFATKGYVVKGIRKHARMRFGEIRYFHSHYFVRLVEGSPPADYYGTQRTGNQKLKDYIEGLRSRRIDYGL